MVEKLDNNNKYGSSFEKALSFEELDFLRFNVQKHRDRIILIGTAFAGLRISELIQTRKEWLRWDNLESGGKIKRVLAIDIPIEDRNILNKYKVWKVKTYKKWLDRGQKTRTTYILDEVLATEFIMFFEKFDGIGEFFKTKNQDSIRRNISMYIIGTNFKKLLIEYHIKQNITEEKAEELRPKLSAHPLRATYENLLFYRHGIDIGIAAELLGHSEEVAKKHYLSNSRGNVKNKLAKQILEKLN